MAIKVLKKQYTISTVLFNTKKEAERQILAWEKEQGFRPKSKVMEVTKVYDVSIEKVVKLKEQEDKDAIPF